MKKIVGKTAPIRAVCLLLQPVCFVSLRYRNTIISNKEVIIAQTRFESWVIIGNFSATVFVGIGFEKQLVCLL